MTIGASCITRNGNPHFATMVFHSQVGNDALGHLITVIIVRMVVVGVGTTKYCYYCPREGTSSQ